MTKKVNMKFTKIMKSNKDIIHRDELPDIFAKLNVPSGFIREFLIQSGLLNIFIVDEDGNEKQL
jgi:hypothetical protein